MNAGARRPLLPVIPPALIASNAGQVGRAGGSGLGPARPLPCWSRLENATRERTLTRTLADLNPLSSARETATQISGGRATSSASGYSHRRIGELLVPPIFGRDLGGGDHGR